jgi:hypothetical protein
MDLRYTMTLDDLVDGNRLVLKSFRRLVTIIGVLLIGAGVALVVSGSGTLGLPLVAIGLVDIALMWARPVERSLLRRRVARVIGDECEIGMTDDALTWKQGSTNGVIAWSALTGVREDAHTLALISGGVVRMGLPKRAFSSDAEVLLFRDQVLTQIAAAHPTATAS